MSGLRSARKTPFLNYLARGKIDQGYAAFAAVGYVEYARIPADVKPVRSAAGCDKTDLAQILAVNQVHTIGPHIGYVEHFAVGRKLNVLRHAALLQRQASEELLLLDIHLDHRATKLAACDQVASVGREIHVIHALTRNAQGVAELHLSESRKFTRLRLSATTIAYFPSGV